MDVSNTYLVKYVYTLFMVIVKLVLVWYRREFGKIMVPP